MFGKNCETRSETPIGPHAGNTDFNSNISAQEEALQKIETTTATSEHSSLDTTDETSTNLRKTAQRNIVERCLANNPLLW